MNKHNIENAIVNRARIWVRGTLDSGKAINDGDDSELLYEIDQMCRKSTLTKWDEAVLGCRVLEEMPEINIFKFPPNLVYLGYKGRQYTPLYEDNELFEVVEVGKENELS